jgi:8-oxo-dGTP pyrophosphatase MutT (NUDIX family)
MISVHLGGQRFQVRAAAVVIHEHAVLLHRREGDAYWALPGGRVELGEDARTTLLREMHEELAEPVSCGELLYLVESFFTHAGTPNHEIGLYFRAELPPGSALLDRNRTHWGVEDAPRLEFRWFDLRQLASVDLRPVFLKEALAIPTLSLRHIVQRESTA